MIQITISNREDEIRTNPSSITDQLIQSVNLTQLEYSNGNFGDKIVLTGSNQKETIQDENFNMEFSRKTFDLLTYVNWDNVVIAGGSLVNIITKSTEKISDVDMFVYGLDVKNAKKKIDHIINSIKQKSLDMGFETRVYMNKHVINLYIFDKKKLLQVQIILRLYDTLAQVLVGFDVDCCCIGYNGKNLITTTRGLNALKYRVNVANLKRRSPSYENRLIKYSFRGFDVITDFEYKEIYNKMFFMASENYGFTRLLEQELINNGQLKNIIFSNTLRFRQTSSYTSAHSVYAKYELEIKDVQNTEACITKFNANIDDENMKFKKYSMDGIELMEQNVTEQFTGSFNPITDENWVKGKNTNILSTNSVILEQDEVEIESDFDGSDDENLEYEEVDDLDELEENEEIGKETKINKSIKAISKKNSEPICTKSVKSNKSETGSVIIEAPIVQQKISNPNDIDELGRSQEFISLKYNSYSNISTFENINISDMSNFDAKCLAVMYVNSETDVVKIVENKYIPATRNMYKISPVQLAILLGRTNLAIKLMKGHSWETVKELIYMVDNDKLFTNYCNSTSKSLLDVDNGLILKFDCENISNNIHNQTKEDVKFDELYTMSEYDLSLKFMTEPFNWPVYSKLDFDKLTYEVIKILFDNGTPILFGSSQGFTEQFMVGKLIKTFEPEEHNKYLSIMTKPNERKVFNYLTESFTKSENAKSIQTSENIKKYLIFKNKWYDGIDNASISELYSNINQINPKLLFCMGNINEPKLNLETINKLIGSYGKAFDTLVNFVIWLDDVNLIQKLINKDDLYVKLKYNYKIDTTSDTSIGQFLDKIDKDRQNEKIKTNVILKNTDAHVNALNDGELKEGYDKTENVFGMTPDDNIIAKLLLMYNKVFNKSEQMNDKDKTTLKNLRKSVANIRRNSEQSMVNTDYFYSIELHNLFFGKETN